MKHEQKKGPLSVAAEKRANSVISTSRTENDITPLTGCQGKAIFKDNLTSHKADFQTSNCLAGNSKIEAYQAARGKAAGLPQAAGSASKSGKFQSNNLIHGNKEGNACQQRTYNEIYDNYLSASLTGNQSRMDRYGKLKSRADKVSHYLREQSYKNKDNPLWHTGVEVCSCGSYLEFRHYFEKNITTLHAARMCKKPLLCPLCAARRAVKCLRAYLPKLRTVADSGRFYMVTLTVKNGTNLRERYNHLKKAIQTLMKNGFWNRSGKLKRNYESSAAIGAIGSFEFKKGKNSNEWHPHIHMIWLCDREPDAFTLSEQWKEITGDSMIVDVRPITSNELPDNENNADMLGGGLVEVFKYALKFSSMSVADQVEAWLTLSGKRLIHSWGCFRGITPDPSYLDEPLSDADEPYVTLFYRWTGYNYQAFLPNSLRNSENIVETA